MLQLFGKVFVVGVAVNFPWEMAQAYLYAPMGDWITATTRCFGAAIVDGVILLGIAVAGAAVFRGHDWIRRLNIARALFSIVAGGIVAMLIEYVSLKTGRWSCCLYRLRISRPLARMGRCGASPVRTGNAPLSASSMCRVARCLPVLFGGTV